MYSAVFDVRMNEKDIKKNMKFIHNIFWKTFTPRFRLAVARSDGPMIYQEREHASKHVWDTAVITKWEEQSLSLPVGCAVGLF